MQTLPAGGGRILLYDGAAVRLGLDEATGAEVVLGVTATGDIPGPRGLQVGMTAQAAAGLFRCDADVYASGGAIYIEGEAYGEPPFAEMSAESDGEATIRRSDFGMSYGLAGEMVGDRVDVRQQWRSFFGVARQSVMPVEALSAARSILSPRSEILSSATLRRESA